MDKDYVQAAFFALAVFGAARIAVAVVRFCLGQ